MSEEVFEIVCSMDRRKVELQIVLQCAPTLAGLKTSNLLILPKDLEEQARVILRHTGLVGYRLVYDRHRVVFLVFKRDMLISYLKSDEVKSFLASYEYDTDCFGACLKTFQRRYEDFVKSRKNFPHEMGAFLGYPMCDVKGFIENEGDGFLIAGYWKVYGDANRTKQLFELFDETKDDMVCMLSKGYTLNQIISEQSRASLAS